MSIYTLPDITFYVFYIYVYRYEKNNVKVLFYCIIYDSPCFVLWIIIIR